MSRGSIWMLQSNPNFSISTDRIFARHDLCVSTLIVPFKVEFTETLGGSNKLFSKAQPLFFKGELRASKNSVFCGESIVFVNQELSANQKSIEAQFQFSFSHSVTHQIEKSRNGDLLMSVAVTAQSALYEDLVLTGQIKKSFVTGFDKASGQVDFQIAQSDWINNLLPQLGHQSFRLIEVPIASQIIPAEYSSALFELEQAKAFFLDGYYDKVASHCRVALEPFKQQLPELRKSIESDSKFNWIKALSEGTFDWLDKILKTTYAITSKTHHPPSTGHFSRVDAEIIMMITTAVISFVGNLGASK